MHEHAGPLAWEKIHGYISSAFPGPRTCSGRMRLRSMHVASARGELGATMRVGERTWGMGAGHVLLFHDKHHNGVYRSPLCDKGNCLDELVQDAGSQAGKTHFCLFHWCRSRVVSRSWISVFRTVDSHMAPKPLDAPATYKLRQIHQESDLHL